MEKILSTRCTAFEGTSRIASGALADVARKAKEVLDRGGKEPILIFDDGTSRVIELDFRGTEEDVLKRLEERESQDPFPAASVSSDPKAPQGPGRPKLGVVAREVTLLPRHWEWLTRQPGGASVALRKLVDEARHVNENRDDVRRAQESAYRFMSAMAGNQPGYEEATRALFAGNRERFEQMTETWPPDVREYAAALAAAAMSGRTGR